MGYDARQTDSSFLIKKKNKAKAFKHLKSCYIGQLKSLKDFLEDDGWEVTYNDDGDITDINFLGENWHSSDLVFMRNLARFVEAGSYIQFSCNGGEDLWRIVFDGEDCSIVHPKIIWE